jgi:hypothetical protein
MAAGESGVADGDLVGGDAADGNLSGRKINNVVFQRTSDDTESGVHGFRGVLTV